MILLVSVFLLLMVLGAPIGFVVLGSSVTYFLFNPLTPSIVAQRMATALESFPLLAIPFFIVAGVAMARGGIAHRLYDFVNVLVGHWRGGLAQIAVMNSLFLGAMSGSSNADAAIDARTIAPIMRKQGYSNGFASVVSATSGAIAPMMPPSIGLIIYGLLTDTSIGKLFMGGVVPAFILTVALCLTVWLVARKRGYKPANEQKLPAKYIIIKGRAALWALVMPVMLLVGLRFGWFTPTELGAIAAAYAFFVGLFVYKGFEWRDTYSILKESVHITANVLFIIVAAAVFSLVLSLEQVPQQLIGYLLNISENKYIVLLILSAFFLVLGTFLEGLALMVILAPLLVQVARNVGIDPVHFGVVIVLITTIGSMTPPVGTVLYTVCSITKCSIEEFSAEFVPFIFALLAVVGLLIIFPPLVTFLPNLLF